MCKDWTCWFGDILSVSSVCWQEYVWLDFRSVFKMTFAFKVICPVFK